MFRRLIDFLWPAIELLCQLVLAAVLIALIMGDAAGSVINSIYGNVRELLASLNPTSVAVAAALYLFWRLYRNRAD